MADWNQPTLSSTYTSFLTSLQSRDSDVAAMMDSATVTVTNPVSGMKRWNSTNNYWEKYNGTTWVALTSTYNLQLNTGSTVNNTPIGATTTSTGAFTTLASSGITTLATGSRVLIAGATDDGSNTVQVNGTVKATSASNISIQADSGGAVRQAAVLSTTNTDTNVALNSVGALKLQNKNSSTNNNFTGIDFWDAGAAVARIASVNLDQTNHSGHLAFVTGNAAVYGERMRVTYLGNILIGTTTDDATNKLQVNGAAKFFSTVTLTSDPTTAYHAATKQYVDNSITSTLSTAAYLPKSAGPSNSLTGSLYLAFANAGIEIGDTASTNTPYIDFHSSSNNIDYDARISVTGGNTSVGQGNVAIAANTVALNVASASVSGPLTVTDPSSSGTASLTISATADTTNGVNLKLIGDGATTPNKTIRVKAGTLNILNSAYSSSILTLDDSGNLTTTANVTAYSDASLKENVETIQNALALVKNLRGVRYNRKDLDGKPRQVGVIAQETQKVVPEVVQEMQDGILSVAYGNLVGVLIEAVKELAEEVEALKHGA